jgi:hypothetical protein
VGLYLPDLRSCLPVTLVFAWLRCVGAARCCVPRFPSFLTCVGGRLFFMYFLSIFSLQIEISSNNSHTLISSKILK